MKDSQAGAALTAVGASQRRVSKAPSPRLHLTGSLKTASRSTPAHTAPNRSGTHLFLTANAPQGRVGSAPFPFKTPAKSATRSSEKSESKQVPVPETQLPFHAALWRAAYHPSHYRKPFSGNRNGPSPC